MLSLYRITNAIKGEEFSNLARTIAINIIEYRLFNDEEWRLFHSCFAVLNTKDVQHALTKDLEIHFVELPKLTSSKKRNARHLERWLRYLSPKTTMEERRRLAMEDANIQTAMEAEKEFVKNPICITAYGQHQKYLRDKYAREKFARKEGEVIGEVRGFAKGEAKAERDMINALHASGMSAEEIATRLQKDIAAVRQILQ